MQSVIITSLIILFLKSYQRKDKTKDLKHIFILINIYLANSGNQKLKT